MYVARLRYIQSVHEPPEHRNPDILVKHFLPLLQRWRVTWLRRKALLDLRADPFYYFLVARTRYYDRVIQDAVADGVSRVVGIGCGADTRAHRFRDLLSTAGVQVLECDQPEAIRIKQRLAQRFGLVDQVEYLPIDLNDSSWPSLSRWLGIGTGSRTLVMMEGVSPYINHDSFCQFLEFLATTLAPGSHIAYDYKIRGVKDDFGRSERSNRLFRLPQTPDEVATFHNIRGLRVEQIESSAELSVRLLPGFSESTGSAFTEDVLVRLRV